jgi:hypothetical protein
MQAMIRMKWPMPPTVTIMVSNWRIWPVCRKDQNSLAPI